MRSRSPALYEALVAAGAPADKALEAADSVGFADTRFSGVDDRFARVETTIGQIKKGMLALAVAVGLLALGWIFGR